LSGENRDMARTAQVTRSTKETSIDVSINLDGSGTASISTGIPFYDHMLEQLARHGGFDLTIAAKGDLHIDTHHTVEDVAISVGEALREALGDKAGVRRFASGLYPLDEALVEVALDLSGRAFVAWNVELPECLPLGNPAFDPSLAEHAVSSLASAAAITLHVNLRAGRNVHHIIEATFKGLARCLRDAVRIESAGVPSTKGVLS
jgi:imidazoleglycerol-phosphate dehydratase